MRIARFCFAVIFLAASMACVRAQPGAAPPAAWSAEQHMQCGASRVSIATHCREVDDDMPYCDSQVLSVTTGAEVRTTAYRLPLRNGDQPMIVGAACYAKGKDALLVLERTNFGNCMICEWRDVFSGTGVYLGSGEGMNEGESLAHRALAPAVGARLRALEADPQAKLGDIPNITRTPPRR